MAALALLRPVRPAFHLDPTPDELAALTAHFGRTQAAVREGRVVLAGPCEDGSLGVVVFPKDDAPTAEAWMQDDPCVAAGVMTVEVRPFRLSLFGTGTGRDWTGFTQAIHIRASQTSLWRMLATCQGMERWFLAKAEAWTADGRAWPSDRELEAGLRFRFSWQGLADAPLITEDDTVLAVEPGQRLRMGWYQDKGWVDVRLMPLPDGRVTVELEQRMAPTADFAFLEGAYVGCKEGWSFFLSNLKSVAEGGADLRERAPDRKGLVNT